VAALIAILSGIGIIAINEMWESNIRKATIAESAQLATALSMAYDDVQFYPRLDLLNRSQANVLLNAGGTGFGVERVYPGLDYYGFVGVGAADPSGTRLLNRVLEGWRGTYMGMSATRDRSSRGGRSGIVRMRLPQLVGSRVNDQDISVVDWPADVYGQPYLLYQLVTIILPDGRRLARFIERESEEADFLNAVVSYGANGFPGGNERTNDEAFIQQMEAGALYVAGDAFGDEAHFTLRTANATQPNLRLSATVTLSQVLFTLSRLPPGATQPQVNNAIQTGEVGLIDRGTDDIVYRF